MKEQLALLNAELDAVNEQLADLARLQRYEVFIQKMLAKTDAQLREARQNFNREVTDVVNLERMSLERLWHAVAGDLPEVLSQEKRQLVVAASSLKLTDDEYRQLSRKLCKIQVRIKRLGDPESERKRLLEQKIVLLESMGRASDPATQAQVATLQEDLAARRSQVRDVFDALAATDQVEQRLVTARRHLGAIAGWQKPNQDVSQPATAMDRYQRIGQVTRSLQQVHQALNELVQELTEIDQTWRFPIDVDSFKLFQKGFLQGFHIEWLVENRLDDSDWNLNAVEHSIEAVQEELRTRRKQLARNIGQLELKLHLTLEQWGDSRAVDDHARV